MAYASWSVVFGEQPSAAKWNILGTNDAYFDSIVGSGTAWASWSPSYTNLTIGSGTVTAKYVQIGKTVFWSWELVLSTTTVGTAPTISLPVTSVAYNAAKQMADGVYVDTGTANFKGIAGYNSTTTVALLGLDAANSRFVVAAGVPHVWANTDVMSLSGFYQAA